MAGLGEPYMFEFAMVRSTLVASCAYLSYGGIQICAMIPPTYWAAVRNVARDPGRE
jgi:hypothetical protein